MIRMRVGRMMRRNKREVNDMRRKREDRVLAKGV
jgi:hypothetical protein